MMTILVQPKVYSLRKISLLIRRCNNRPIWSKHLDAGLEEALPNGDFTNPLCPGSRYAQQAPDILQVEFFRVEL